MRGRVGVIIAMGALVVVATLAVAGMWVWFDRKSVAAIEHYGWEGWELVFLPGACVAGVLWVVGRGVYWVWTLRRNAGLRSRWEFWSHPPHSTRPGPGVLKSGPN